MPSFVRVRLANVYRATRKIAMQGRLLRSFLVCLTFLFVQHRPAFDAAEIKYFHLIGSIIKALRKGVISGTWGRIYIGISDPMSVPWGGTSAAAVGRSFSQHNVGDPLTQRSKMRFFGIAGIMKRAGWLNELELLCEEFLEHGNAQLRSAALQTKADIHHLYLSWHRQTSEFREGDYYLTFGDVFDAKNDSYENHFRCVDPATIERLYQTAALLEPENGWIHYSLGRLYRDLGRNEEALSEFDKAATLRAGMIPRILATRLRYLLTKDVDSHYKESSGQRMPFGSLFPKTVAFDSMNRISLTNDAVHQIWPNQNLQLDYTAVFRGESKQIVRSLSFSPKSYGFFQNLRIMSTPFSVVDDSKMLTDTIQFPQAMYPLFNPNLLDYTDREASVFFSSRPDVHSRVGKTSIHIDEPVIVLGGGGRPNYFHQIFDGLGSLALIESDDFFADRRIVLTGRPAAWFVELKQMLGVENKILSIPRGARTSEYLFHDALQLGCPSKMTIPDPRAISFLRRRLCPEPGRVRPGRFVHLGRSKTRAMNSSQRHTFYKYLEAQGFEILDMAGRTVEEQRELLKDVDVLSAEGGAALSNLLFCPAETRVIVVAPTTHVYEVWSVLTNVLGQDLWMCLEETRESYPNQQFMWSSAELDVDIEAFDLCLEQARDRTPQSGMMSVA